MSEPSAGDAGDHGADVSDWNRLDPRMLLIHPVREIGRAVPLLFGALLAGRNLSGGITQWLWPLVGAVGVIGFSLLRWFTTRYRFTPEQVQLRTGLVQRQTLTAATEKVRAVDVTAPLLHRLLGLAAVEIGTGAGDRPVKLDGLPAPEAARLRADLLQRRNTSGPPAQVDLAEGDLAGGPDWIVPGPQADTVLYRFNPVWLRYAPLGFAGLATAGVVLGFLFQVVDQLDLWPSRDGLPDAVNRAESLGVVTVAVLVGLVAIALVSLLAMVAAALTYFGFTLGRDHAGATLHVQRGLVTSRSTSLETRRLRGVQLHRPVLLRTFGAARLSAIVTGFDQSEAATAQRTLLAPASPLGVVTAAGDRVLRSAALAAPLRAHGRAATRRRYTRTLGPALVLGGGMLAAGWALGRLPPAIAATAVLLVLAAALGRSRARLLGHAVTSDYLITQSGSLALKRSAVDLDATAAVTVRRTFFQRRAGVATVELALGAGAQGYAVMDLPDSDADALAGQLVGRALRRR